MFKDRIEAGQKLVKILEEFKNSNAIILALPRGGAIVGAEISKALNLPLDIIITRKIGSLESEEYAIGAIDIDGDGVWNEKELKYVDKDWLKQEIEKEKAEAKRRLEAYRKGKQALDIKNKIVILVDDGIATGLTMKAAVKYAKKLGSQRVVVASPLAAKESTEELSKEAEIKILETPPYFWAIGQFYENFPQVEDEEVIKILSMVK